MSNGKDDTRATTAGMDAVVARAVEVDATEVSRRQAFGRFAAYTAPVMIAMLTSEQAQAGSAGGFCERGCKIIP